MLWLAFVCRPALTLVLGLVGLTVLTAAWLMVVLGAASVLAQAGLLPLFGVVAAAVAVTIAIVVRRRSARRQVLIRQPETTMVHQAPYAPNLLAYELERALIGLVWELGAQGQCSPKELAQVVMKMERQAQCRLLVTVEGVVARNPESPAATIWLMSFATCLRDHLVGASPERPS